MIESIPQLNPDRPPPGERPPADPPGGIPALTNAQVRMLALGFAGFETLTVAGVWGLHIEEFYTWSWWYIGTLVLATLVSGAGGLFFLIRVRRKDPVTRNEPRVMVALLLNFLWPAVPTWIALWLPLRHGGDIADPMFQYDGFGYIVLATLGLLTVHGIPAMILAAALLRHIGTDDSEWTPYQARDPDRTSVLFGMSMLVGGWTAAGGISVYAVVWDPHMLFNLGEILSGLGLLNFAIAGGMFAGMACSVFSATLPDNTRFDRSIPRLFIPVVLVGVLVSAAHPIVGALAAGVTSVVMSFVVRARCKLIPFGQCQRCAYDLEGLGTNCCPECGYEHQPHEMPAPVPQPPTDERATE